MPAAFVRELQSSTLHRPVPPEFFDRVVAESGKVPAHVYRDVWEALASFDDRADLGRITAPVLVLCGDHDALFERGQQGRLLGTLPDARLEVLPDSGHSPNREDPAGIAARLNAVLLAG